MVKKVVARMSVNQPPFGTFPILENKKTPSIDKNTPNVIKYSTLRLGNFSMSKKQSNIEVMTISMVIANPYVASIAVDFLKIAITSKQPAIKNQFIKGMYI
jgi:hypothetical protein